MTQQIKVSVALCTHNGARYISEQIESILAQSRPVDEIVISDDASTDGTIEAIERVFNEHHNSTQTLPTLRLMRNDPPLRVTKNFEQALLATTGDLVALCDQDDIWESNRIERLIRRFDDPQVVFLFSNARQVDSNGADLGHDLFTALAMTERERILVASGRAYQQFLRRNLATGATVMLKRSLVDLAAPFPESWLHDEWLAVVAAAYDGVRMHDESLTRYRQHDNNQVGMRKLDFQTKLSMFAEPRTERNQRLFSRASSLAQRIDGFTGIPGEYRAMAHEKFLFEQARQNYPDNRIFRVVPIARQLCRGRYKKYGTGLKDAVRNLVQPV